MTSPPPPLSSQSALERAMHGATNGGPNSNGIGLDRSSSAGSNHGPSSLTRTGSNSSSHAIPSYAAKYLDRTSAGSLSRAGSISRVAGTGMGTAAGMGGRTAQPPSSLTRRPTHRVGHSMDSLRGRWEERAAQAERDGVISPLHTGSTINQQMTGTQPQPTTPGRYSMDAARPAEMRPPTEPMRPPMEPRPSVEPTFNSKRTSVTLTATDISARVGELASRYADSDPPPVSPRSPPSRLTDLSSTILDTPSSAPPQTTVYTPPTTSTYTPTPTPERPTSSYASYTSPYATPTSAPPTETRFRAMDLLLKDRSIERPLPQAPKTPPNLKRFTLPSQIRDHNYMSPHTTGTNVSPNHTGSAVARNDTGTSSSSSAASTTGGGAFGTAGRPRSPTAPSTTYSPWTPGAGASSSSYTAQQHAFATPTPNRISLGRDAHLESSSIPAVKRLSGYALHDAPVPPSIIEPSSSPPPPPPPEKDDPPRDPMRPPQYRSSAIGSSNKYPESLGRRAGQFGPNSSVGRRLGRHLPRIASGDGREDDNDERPLPSAVAASITGGSNTDFGPPKQPVMTESMRRRDRRNRALDARRLWDEDAAPPPSPIKPPSAYTYRTGAGQEMAVGENGELLHDTTNTHHSRAGGQGAAGGIQSPPDTPYSPPPHHDNSIVIPGITNNHDEVQGLKGRIRFSKQPRAAAAITPAPSARLLAHSAGQPWSPTKSTFPSAMGIGSGPNGNNNFPSTAQDLPSSAQANIPASTRLGIGLWHDRQRHLLQAYEYLCHVGEAQQWIEGCLGFELGFGVVEMEEGLRNGVVLAKLSNTLVMVAYEMDKWEGEPGWGVRAKKVYGEGVKLSFRHSDNVNLFLVFVRAVGLPESFVFELVDLYEKKNLPKVIYCIHALSHLLSRRGMTQRIGNLLGRLEFSDDQLNKTQKGLTASGVQMPNFGDVGKELAKEINEEPEVEVESEDERRDRMLLAELDSIIALQALARGYLARQALQSMRTRLLLSSQRHIPKLQALLRGHLVRKRIASLRNSQASLHPFARALQAHARGLLVRQRVRYLLTQLDDGMVGLQAQARGVLVRRRLRGMVGALRRVGRATVSLQALARASLVRRRKGEMSKVLEKPIVMASVVALQSQARGVLVRWRLQRERQLRARVVPVVVQLGAQIRGVLVRRAIRKQLMVLDDEADVVLRIQSAARGWLARKRLLGLIRGLRRAESGVIGLQALARARLERKKHQEMTHALAEPIIQTSIGALQAQLRAALTRNRHVQQAKEFVDATPEVAMLQAACRGALVRNAYWPWRDHLHNNVDTIIFLQALLRGAAFRRKFRAKMAFYRANLEKVVKIQSLFRAKEQREQYRQLTLGKNVGVATIKNFVHLLDDSEADFEDEIEIERLRKRVVEGIRENQTLEADVSGLDSKIALVINNVKSFDELLRARRRHGADSAAAHAARASVLAAHGDPFGAAGGLDSSTKRRLELYQGLFYLLQVKGEYLARLFFLMSRVDASAPSGGNPSTMSSSSTGSGSSSGLLGVSKSSVVPMSVSGKSAGGLPLAADWEKTKRMAERVVLTLFGYGQDRREDYLLLKMFQMSIHEEVRAAPALADILDGRSMYLNVALHYVRPKQTVFVRETLVAVIKSVVNEEDLDLETDPVVIYRAKLDTEEMRSGQKSSKPRDLSFHQAVNDPATRTEFIQHLQKLQALTKDFVHAIIASTRRMPYGLRCIARETLLALRVKWPDEPDTVLASIIGKLIYYRYINPAIVAPDQFDIIDHGLTPQQRRNLTEISKMLQQIARGVIFGDENPCLTPLNSYVADAIKQFGEWFLDVADVDEAETHFHAHEFLDATVQPKPIYISPNEVYSMQKLLMQNIDSITKGARDDPVREILKDLEGVPNLGSDELNDARDRTITLELTSRFAVVEDPHADEKALWVQAKRCVLALLRVQPGKDLVESLMQPVTEDHEILWEDIIDSEMASERMRQRKRRMPSTTGLETGYRLEDIQSLSFREVKAHTIFFLLELEKLGKLHRSDGYQGILNAIAADVREKHRKRISRKNELDSMKQALKDLRKRKADFEAQIDSYKQHAEAAMNTMQQKGKTKKRSTLFNPFSRQANHLRDLQRSGKGVPQYGSFKYSAQDFYERGILLSIDQSSPRQFDRIEIIISSHIPGEFVIEAINNSTGSEQLIGRSHLKMEDLLQAQFESRVSLSLFDGKAKVNLNTLLYQINKKFYV